jgi:hypothetical protein
MVAGAAGCIESRSRASRLPRTRLSRRYHAGVRPGVAQASLRTAASREPLPCRAIRARIAGRSDLDMSSGPLASIDVGVGLPLSSAKKQTGSIENARVTASLGREQEEPPA